MASNTFIHPEPGDLLATDYNTGFRHAFARIAKKSLSIFDFLFSTPRGRASLSARGVNHLAASNSPAPLKIKK